MKQIDSKTFQFSDDETILEKEFENLLKQSDAESFVIEEMINSGTTAIVNNIISNRIIKTEEESSERDISVITFRFLTSLTLLNRETHNVAWSLVHAAGLPDGLWTYSYDTKLFTEEKND